MTIPLNQSGRH